MPYLDEHRKGQLDRGSAPVTPGDLTYIFTREAVAYLGDKYGFSDLAEAIAALECAKLELYRRLAAPYEDGKIVDNGDVFTVVVEVATT